MHQCTNIKDCYLLNSLPSKSIGRKSYKQNWGWLFKRFIKNDLVILNDNLSKIMLALQNGNLSLNTVSSEYSQQAKKPEPIVKGFQTLQKESTVLHESLPMLKISNDIFHVYCISL